MRRRLLQILQKLRKKNQGSAILISLSMLLLVVTVIFSISNIYMNKIQSIKNINTYYDSKINEVLDKRIEVSEQEEQNKNTEKENENKKKLRIEESRKKIEELEKDKIEAIEKIKEDREKFDKEILELASSKVSNP